MSAGLDIGREYQPTIVPVTQPVTSLPSTGAERANASWAAGQSDDHYWNIQAAKRREAQYIIDDIHAVTGEKLLNPYDNSPTMEEIRANPGVPTVNLYAQREQKLRDAALQVRDRMDPSTMPPNFLNVDRINERIASQGNEARANEERLSGTGNGLAAFGASSAAGMMTPHGIASMFMPVSRMPLATAEGIAAGWVRNVGREALVQAAGQTAAQAVGTAIDYGTRKPLGTEQTPGEIAEELMGAAAGGALLGGAFRGIHLGINKLRGHGLEVPQDVKDATTLMTAADLYGDKNALKIPTAAHEAAQDRAIPQVALGRAADVADIVAPLTRPADIFEKTSPETAAPGIFHGSSAPDLRPSGDHYSTLNYYGQGFYTTDSHAIAGGYSKKGATNAGEQNIYRVTENRPLKMLNGEAALTPEVEGAARRANDATVLDALDEKPKNLRDLFDKVRSNGSAAGMSADEIQEVFASISHNIQSLGYDGFTHQGGLRTGKPAHNVKIYFNPEKDITLSKEGAGGSGIGNFAEELAKKRDEVWADKSVVGRIKEGLPQNENFVTEEARLRVMRAEAADTIERLQRQFDLTKEDIDAIGRQYRRQENETPAQAATRAADDYVTAQEQGAVFREGLSDEADRAESERWLREGDRALPEEVQSLLDMVRPKVAEPDPFEHDIPFIVPEKPTAGRPADMQTPADKSLEAQVKDLVSEEGPASAAQKKAYEEAAQAEKEANIAIGCVGGAL